MSPASVMLVGLFLFTHSTPRTIYKYGVSGFIPCTLRSFKQWNSGV